MRSPSPPTTTPRSRRIPGYTDLYRMALLLIAERVSQDARLLILGARRRRARRAWDSLFIPEILGHTARVESACPVTRISLTVGPQRIIEAEPSGVVISMVTYETG